MNPLPRPEQAPPSNPSEPKTGGGTGVIDRPDYIDEGLPSDEAVGYGEFPPEVWLLAVPDRGHIIVPVPEYFTDAVVCFVDQESADKWTIRPTNTATADYSPHAVKVTFDEAREVAKKKPEYCKALALLDPDEDVKVLDICYVK